jgi:hypothetical protein
VTRYEMALAALALAAPLVGMLYSLAADRRERL